MKYLLCVLTVLVPASAWAAGGAPAAALLAKVPPLPGDATTAYSQWTDDKASLSPGPALSGLKQAIQGALMADSQAMAGAQVQLPSGPPPAGDAKLAETITLYPDDTVHAKIAGIVAKTNELDQSWQNDEDALHDQLEKGLSKISACKSDPVRFMLPVGQMKPLVDKYDAASADLAAQYLAKIAPMDQQLLGFVRLEANHADTAMSNWGKLKSAAMKSMLHATALGAHMAAVTEVNTALGVESSASRQAAQVIANKKDEARKLSSGACANPI